MKNIFTPKLVWNRISLSLLLTVFFLFLVNVLQGQISSTTTGGNWDATGTWVGGVVPTSTDAVIIRGNATVTVNINNAACASIQINPNDNNQTGILSFNNASVLSVGGNVTIGGSGNRRGSINMTNGGTLRLAGSFITTNLNTFTRGSGTIEYNASGNQNVTSLLGAYNNLTISGSGTKTLAASINVASTLTVNSGTTLALSTFTLGATNAPTSVVLQNGGTASTISGTGVLTLGGNVTVNKITGTGVGATISCPVALTNAITRTFTVADETTTATDLTVSGIVSTTGAITKDGAGTMVLSALNTYTGLTTVNAGLIRVQSNTALGTTAGTTTVTNGAAVEINGSGLSIAEPIILNGTGINSGGSLRNIANNNSWSGAITITATSPRINSDAGLLTLSGGITGTGFALTVGGAGNTTISTNGINTSTNGTLTKDGNGILILSSTNNYTGLTTISAGTLSLGGAASTNTITGDISINGGTLNYSAANDNQIADASNLTISSGTFDPAARTETIGSLTMTGGSLTKAGGTLTLSNASSITGGTLTFSATTSSLTTNNTLTLGGAIFNYTNASNASGNTLNLGGDVSYAATNTAPAIFANTLAGSGQLQIGNGGTRTFDIILASPSLGQPEVQIAWRLTQGASNTALTKTGTGTLLFSNSFTYAGATTITQGELRLNPSANITPATQMILNGGTLSTTNIATGRTITSSSTLNLNANSTIALGSNVHTLIYSNSSAVTWNGTSLTITGWTGTAGASGTAGELFFGNTTGTLSSSQLAKISFSGYPCTATILNTGELVPAALPTATAPANQTYCNGVATSAITLTGTPASVVFDISGGTGIGLADQTGVTSVPSFTPTTGFATITITPRANGCTGTAVTYTITVNENPTTAAAGTDQTGTATCGLTQVTLAANAPTIGTGLWTIESGAGGSFVDATNPTTVFNGVSGTTYVLRWTISNNPCNASFDEVTITLSPTPVINSAVKTSYNGSDLTCSTSTDGEITVNASSGTGPLQYSKDNGSNYQLSNVFSGLAAGIYQIKVKDANDCISTTTTVTITTPAAVTISSAVKTSYNGADLSCSNSTDGEITVTASGGSGALQYSKDNGSNYQLSNVFSGLAAGTYEIVVKDANNCISTTTVTVTLTAPPVLSGTISSQTNVLCAGSTTGSVTVDGSGGTGSLMYSLNGDTYQVSGTFNSLTNGTYTVTVRDANLCTFNVPVTIIATDNTSPVLTCPADITINNTPGLCSGSIDLTGVATATDNCTVASISYSPAGPVFPVGTTLVTVTATDNNGNTSNCTFSVIVIDNEGPQLTCPPDTTVLTDFTVCTYTLADFTPFATAIDNCGGAVTLTQSPLAGTILNPGIHIITITALDILNNSSTCTFNLTVDSNIADRPLYIEGPIDACPFIDSTITANYTIPAVANATSYYWTVPAGVTIINGHGTTGIEVSYNNAFVGQTNITVVAISACDSSDVTILKIRKDVPGIPYRIRGATELCPLAGTGVNAIYYIEPVRYATAYIWVVPAGATIVSGQGDTLIEVSYSGSIISGTISVYATNYCYTSTARILNVAKTLPPVPGAISGESDVCPFMGTGTPTTYSILPVTEAISYTWSVPAGASIVSGQSTTAISVLFSNSFVSGSITVNSVSDCGNSANRSFVLSRFIPSIPAVIAGVTNACPLMGTGTPTSYTILPVINATSYVWTVPSGVTIVSGQGTTSISVTYSNSFVSGNIMVAAQNNCFTSAAKILSISRAIPATPGTISGPTDACPLLGTGAQSTYSISPVANATSYVWTMPNGATIVSGQGTTSIIVTYANSFVNAGFITVAAQNNCSISAAKSLTILRNAPATPGVITGPSNICTLIGSPSNAVYSVTASAFATSYSWSLPIGATIVGPANGTSITVSFSNSFVQGTLYVSAINNCAASGFRSLAIVKVPATPGTITSAPQACPSRNVVYSITPVAGAVSYIWTKPPGTVFTGDSTLASVTVTYPANAVTGTVTVRATNTCGTSAAKSLAVSVAPCPPLTKKPVINNVSEINSVGYDINLPLYKISPNPSTSSFRIDLINARAGDCIIRVTDIYGRIIESQIFKTSPSVIYIGSSYTPGVYFAEIIQTDSRHLLKLIKL